MRTQLEGLAAFENNGLVVHHLSCADFGALGVEEDRGVSSWALGEGFPDSDHLAVVFCMVAMGEVESGDAEALIDEDAGVVRVLRLGSGWGKGYPMVQIVLVLLVALGL
jgi:hypothetical protein